MTPQPRPSMTDPTPRGVARTIAGLALLCAAASPSAQTLRSLTSGDVEIGVKVDNFRLFDSNDDADEEIFKQTVRSEFDMITLGTFQWKIEENRRGEYLFNDTRRVYQWARQSNNNLRIHGHPMVWHKVGEESSWLSSAHDTTARGIMEGYIDALTQEFPAVATWDVVNEPIDPALLGRSDPRDKWRPWIMTRGMDYGPGGIPNFIRIAFERAHLRAPNAELIWAEGYGIRKNEALQNATYDAIQTLLSEGIHIDGVGVHLHLKSPSDFDDRTLFNFLTRISELRNPEGNRLKVYVTELDIQIPSTSEADLQAQARAFAELLERFRAVPTADDFLLWALTDRHPWPPQPRSTLFFGTNTGSTYNRKPAYFAMRTVLQGGTARTSDRSAFAKTSFTDHEAQRGAQTYSAAVGSFNTGDWVKFARVDFGSGAGRVELEYATPESNERIEIRLDGPTGTRVKTHVTLSTGSYDTYQTRGDDLNQTVTGVHDVYVVGGTASRWDREPPVNPVHLCVRRRHAPGRRRRHLDQGAVRQRHPVRRQAPGPVAPRERAERGQRGPLPRPAQRRRHVHVRLVRLRPGGRAGLGRLPPRRRGRRHPIHVVGQHRRVRGHLLAAIDGEQPTRHADRQLDRVPAQGGRDSGGPSRHLHVGYDERVLKRAAGDLG